MSKFPKVPPVIINEHVFIMRNDIEMMNTFHNQTRITLNIGSNTTVYKLANFDK